MKISIIIPVYNEFPTLHKVLERVLEAPLPENCLKEVIVVDDGSTDGTTQVLRERCRTGVIMAHHSTVNQGKGAALRTGIDLASGDIILIQDGDLEYDPNDYAAMVLPILRGETDVVYGSRFRGAARGMAWPNLIANRILTGTANLLYGQRLTDQATAYKAFRATLLKQLPLQCVRFEFCPEVTAKLSRLGHRISEVPISYNARGIADGKKIRATDGLEALWTLVKYRIVPIKSFHAPTYSVQNHS
ncbi:MAG TPA: glycosyltransferase family 2 protein [Bryobacteraceae bacterium]